MVLVGRSFVWVVNQTFQIGEATKTCACKMNMTANAHCLGVVGWCDGPGYTSSTGVSYNLDDSRARAYYACSRCGWGLFGHFYSPLSFLSFFSLSLGDGPISTEILSQRAAIPKTINQSMPTAWFSRGTAVIHM